MKKKYLIIGVVLGFVLGLFMMFSVGLKRTSAYTYTVNYYSNNADYSNSSSLFTTTTLNSSSTSVNVTLTSTKPTWSGRTFLGWGTAYSDVTAKYNPGATVSMTSSSTTLNLYGVWKSKVSYPSPSNGSYHVVPANNQLSFNLSHERYALSRVPVRFSRVGWTTITTTTENGLDTYGYVSKTTDAAADGRGPYSTISVCGVPGTDPCRDDDGGEGSNFKINLFVESTSTTYYIWVRTYYVYAYGNITLKIDPAAWRSVDVANEILYADADYSYNLQIRTRYTYYHLALQFNGGGTFAFYSVGNTDTEAWLTDYSRPSFDTPYTCVEHGGNCWSTIDKHGDQEIMANPGDNFYFTQWYRGGYTGHLWVALYGNETGSTTIRVVEARDTNDSPAISSVSGTSSSWTTSNRTINVSASDSWPGIGYYSCNNNNWYVGSGNFQCTYSSSTTTATIAVKDEMGKTTTRSVNVYVDKTIPSITGGAYNNNKYWYRGSGSTFTFNDTYSGVSRVVVAGSTYNNNTSNSSYSLTIDNAKCGTNCTVTVYDRAGNSTSRTYYRDSYAPLFDCYDATTDDSCDYSYSKTRYITVGLGEWDSGLATKPTLSVWMMDHIPDDGDIFEIQTLGQYYFLQGWNLNDATYHEVDMTTFNNNYNGVVYIFVEVYRYSYAEDDDIVLLYDNVYNYVGYDNYVKFRDLDGHMYDIGYVVFETYYDNSGPSLSISGASSSWTNNSRTITINASDNYMGISAYTCDGSSWMNSTSSSYQCTFDSTKKTATVGSKDSLGNVSTTSVNVYVDKTAPDVSVKYVMDGVWTSEKQEINISASDFGSGVDKFEAYCIAEAQIQCSWQSDDTVKIDSDKVSINGIYYAFVRDYVGNVGVSEAIHILYDPTAPVVNNTAVVNGYYLWYKPFATTFTPVDDGSGIDYYVINDKIVGYSNSAVVFDDWGDACSIAVYNKAGSYTYVKFYRDDKAPEFVIKRGDGEIATGDQLQYLTVAPAIKWPGKIASGTNDSGSGISYARICKDSYVNHIEKAICQNVNITTDVETFGDYQFEDGYNYSINLVDALGNSTSKGDGEVTFFLLSARSVATLFEDNTEVVTLGNAPALQLSDVFSGIYVSSMLGSMTHAFQYIRIVTFNTDTVLNIETLADFVLDYGMTVSLASLYDGGLVTSADGQSSGRAIAYMLCTDTECDVASAPIARDANGIIDLSAESENTATVAAVITPTLAVATRTTNSRSALVFMIALAIMVLLAVEVVFVSKLLKRKSS